MKKIIISLLIIVGMISCTTYDCDIEVWQGGKKIDERKYYGVIALMCKSRSGGFGDNNYYKAKNVREHK